MAMEFLKLLSQIPDPRRAQGKKWQLGPVLLSTILAIASGAMCYCMVHRFIEAHRTYLNAAFGFGWKTAPAYSVVRTILSGLDADEVERVFREHAAMLSGGDSGDDLDASSVVAIVDLRE